MPVYKYGWFPVIHPGIRQESCTLLIVLKARQRPWIISHHFWVWHLMTQVAHWPTAVTQEGSFVGSKPPATSLGDHKDLCWQLWMLQPPISKRRPGDQGGYISESEYLSSLEIEQLTPSISIGCGIFGAAALSSGLHIQFRSFSFSGVLAECMTWTPHASQGIDSMDCEWIIHFYPVCVST